MEMLADDVLTSQHHPETDVSPAVLELQLQESVQRKIQVASGILMTESDFCHKIGLSRFSLHQACKIRRLFSLTDPNGTAYYPAFFLNPRYSRRALESVTLALGTLPGPEKLAFFTTLLPSLGNRTPLDVLEEGQLDVVLATAHAFK